MPRVLTVAGIVSIIALMVGGPLWYKVEYDRRFRNFHVVDEGKLYRSAQLDVASLKHLAQLHGIRTIVDLRDGESAGDQAEATWAESAGIRHVRIKPRSWWVGGDWPVPAEKGLAEFREIMADPRNHPVLVHCWGGVHRTGLYCAIYRLDFQNWSKPEAIAEMRALGYTILDEHTDVQAFLNRYEPQRPGTITVHGRTNFGPIEPVDHPPPAR